MVSQILTHAEVPFTVTSDSREGRLQLTLCGELDFACSDMLTRMIEEEDVALREVLLDVTDLDFIDTSGVRALAAVRSRNETQGRVVAMTSPTPLVRKVMTLMGRVDLLPAR